MRKIVRTGYKTENDGYIDVGDECWTKSVGDKSRHQHRESGTNITFKAYYDVDDRLECHQHAENAIKQNC